MKSIIVVTSLVVLLGMLVIVKADDEEIPWEIALGDIRNLSFFRDNGVPEKDLVGTKKLELPKFDFPAMARPLFKRKRRQTEGDADLK